jgi:hypothetical protein
MSLGKRSGVKVRENRFHLSFCGPIMRQLEPGARALPRFCRDNLTKASKSPFGSPQPFAGPIRVEFVAELSEWTIDGEEFLFLPLH